MAIWYFNIVVNKLLKKKYQVVKLDDIWKIIKLILVEQYSISKLYKIIYQLKNKWYIISIKKDMYYIKECEESVNTEYILQKYYRPFVYSHCHDYIKGFWYIGWLKSLQIMMHNLEIPNELLIITNNKQSHEVVILDKCITTKSYNIQQKPLLKYFKAFTISCNIQWKKIYRANLELALLETLYNCDIKSNNYIVEIIKKILSTYHKKINMQTMASIIKLWKHHTSINRLYILSKYIDEVCAKDLLEIIKKYSYIISW